MPRQIIKNFQHGDQWFVVIAECADGCVEWTVRVNCSLSGTNLQPVPVADGKTYATADDAINAGQIIGREQCRLM